MFHGLSASVRLLLCIHICLGITLEKRFPLNRNGLQFTNMVFNGSLIYAAEDGWIHVLDTSLSVHQSYPTCATDDCGNINKVLTINNSMIVACGTGNDGICQKWDNGTLAYNNSSQSSIQNYPLVSTNIHRPAVGLVHNRYLYMGVSSGDGYGKTKRYLLTQTDLTKNFSLVSTISLLNNGDEIYLVYFRKIFMKGDFVYFLTNQKQTLSTAGYKTKLIRICTNGSNWTKSYTDIVLSCEVEGVDYNLLQDAEFLRSTGKLVATFSIGDDPENPTAESAICVYTIVDVDDAILRAKQDFVTCSTNNSTNKEFDYLDTELGTCVSNMTYQESEYVCPSTGGTKVIGTITLQSNSSLKLADNSSRITKVRGVDRYGRYSDVYLGTDKGTISKVSIDDGLNIVVYESNVTVDKGHTVRDIHITDNHFYVLSNRKVFRFKDTECSEYKTCEVTMKSKNPSCGWCVIENRGSKKTDCMDRTTWLSSLSACVSADITPKYMPVKPNSFITKVTVSLSENFTSGSHQYSLLCAYLKGENRIGPYYQSILFSNGSISCDAPGIEEPGEIRVQLLTNTSQKVVAESTFQVYKCNQFSNCASCLVSPEVNCKWCSNLQCNETCVGADPISSTDSCPSLVNTSGIYIPSGINKTISLNVTNLKHLNGHYYSCILKNTTVDRNALVDFDSSTIKCSVNFSYGENVARSEMPISVVEAASGIEALLKDDFNNTATVYKCEQLATDCTMCNALNKDRYDCHWCVEGPCGHKSKCVASNTCPLPTVTKVVPPAGGYLGFTNIILEGKNFGTTKSDISEVKIGIYACKPFTIHEISNPDFDGFIQQIQCKLPRTGANTSLVGKAEISFKFNGTDVKTGSFRFANPTITSVTPNFTSLLGGTVITMSGTDLVVGNTLNRVGLGLSSTCLNSVYRSSSIVCTTPQITTVLNITTIRLRIDEENYDLEVLFKFLPSPDIEGLVSAKSAVSGGSNFTVRGKNLLNAAEVTVCSSYAGETSEGNLTHATPSNLTFQSPPAPPAVLKELRENENGQGRRRRKRSTFDPSITVEVTIKMDGYEKTYPYTYFKDPVFEEFSDFEATKIIRSKNEEIVMEGSYLNLAAEEADYRVSVGKFGSCYVTLLTETNLTCVLPAQNPDDVDKLEVHVELGFFRQKVGYVKYDLRDEEGDGNSILVIVLAVIGGLVLISVIGSVFGVFKYTRVKRKAKKIEKSLATMEMKIKEVVLEEFLDMHTTLSRVNESLVEIGFPYNSYQRYSFLMMFPGEWNMEEHPLMHRPDVPDETSLRRGMDTFEELLLNKFFLLSVISTMQKQKKFFLKEKCNMAGYLSVILLGKMEYFHEEILTKLLTNLVSVTPAKSQKTLFRRCESITEKLLSNWLALSLYHQVKIHSGSPLYMLLKGTQLTMESGPIDAITGNSKYTLSEEKLLRQDDKPNTLTLRIMVENNEEIRDCKVLDCDTISQVKAKCLNQIYVNYPASQLTVDSSELSLEWHWGIGGRIVIKDEDTSSKREGRLLQLNTLEHYRVQDESSMALVDPCGMIDQEDYMNLAQVRVNIDTGNNDNQKENPQDEVDGPLTRWHLMKPETEEQKSAVTDELYLSRLITTKQSVLEFMKNLFKSIFDNAVPPPAKSLFDLLDRLGEENKVDPDVVHAWKSHCYLIRFWGTLISKPYNLFDQRIPPYVETSMEVLSQVLIESCSLKASQYTKDSSPGKLIFKTDMMTYREEVKSYYTRARDTLQTPEEFRDYLKALNQFQNNQMSFNKQTALYTLYLQLQPYMDEIMEDLENNTDTKNLHLDRKLANLNNSMQEED